PALLVAIPTVNRNRNMPTNSTTSLRWSTMSMPLLSAEQWARIDAPDLRDASETTSQGFIPLAHSPRWEPVAHTHSITPAECQAAGARRLSTRAHGVRG